MPQLSHTVIIPNNTSCFEHTHAVSEYISKEVVASRMSGPYTRDRVDTILSGPFFTSPFIIAVQTQEEGVAKIADRDLENNTNLNPINDQAWPGSMERSDGRDLD